MLTALLDDAFARVAQLTAHRHWRWGLAGLCLLVALLWQTPKLNHLYAQLISHTEGLDYNLGRIQDQAAHPLTPHADVAMTHLAKMAFRLTVPLLMRWLHLGLVPLLALQVLLGGLVYWVAAGQLAASFRGDRVAATLLVLALSRTYFGYAFSYDLFGYFDGLGFAALLLALGARHWAVVGALVLVGGFVDERVLVASPLLVFWYGARARGWEAPAGWRWLATRSAAGVYAAWGLYAVLRLYLTWQYHLPNPSGGGTLVGISALSHNAWQELLALGFSDSLKSFWLVLVLAVLVLGRLRRYGLLALAAACAAPILGGAFLITDNTRSLAYGMPAVFIACHLLGHYTTAAERRYLAATVLFFALLMPSYFVTGWAQYHGPLWLVVLRALTKQYYL